MFINKDIVSVSSPSFAVSDLELSQESILWPLVW
jgi:hypothetical protein